jgi:hypothetical protein
MGLVTTPITSAIAGAAGPTTTIYDSTDPTAVQLPSLAFEATAATEIGNQVQFAPGTSRTLNNVVVSMDSWACGTSGTWNADDCVTTPGATFAQPITLNLYAVNSDNSAGALLDSVTQTVNLAYRPSADNTNCTGANAGEWYNAADSTCHNGIVTNATLNLGAVTVPDKVIYGIEIRTSDYGDPAIHGPLGDATACHAASNGCPYDSLNVALSLDPTNVTTGSDPLTNGIYWNTSYGANYCDGGASAVGTFRFDGGCWGDEPPYTTAPYDVPAVQFNAEPTCTTVCYVSPTGNDTNSGAADSPFATIQHAVDTVTSGGTVHVASGTYDENVTITQPLQLLGANAGVRATGATRAAESTISTSNVSGNDLTVDIASPGVTVDGFSLQQTATVTCSTCAAFGVQVEPNASGAVVADNIISGMTTSGTSPAGAGNPIGIDVGADLANSPNGVTIAGNLIESIASGGTQHRSAFGIEVGDSTSHPVGTGLVITNNHITGISSAGWGGYGIITNRPTTGTQISGNSFDTIYGGGWSRGIGLEAVETSASISNNSISGITTANPAAGAADDLYVDPTDTGAGSTTVTDNSLTGPATTAGILNLATGTVSATPNWWGCVNGPGSSGCPGVSGPITIFPGIASYTADPTKAGQPGFWPTAVTMWSNTSTITSAPSVQIAVGKKIRFTVTTHGNPVATVSATGLPAWMTLVPGTGSHAGTAKLGGVGPLGGGDFTFTLNATNGTGPDATQTFTVHVLAISSLASASFSKSGPPTQSFTITTTGAGAGVTLSATLTGNQAGLTFRDNGNGTATISGVPEAAARPKLLKITATSGASVATQKLAVGISA